MKRLVCLSRSPRSPHPAPTCGSCACVRKPHPPSSSPDYVAELAIAGEDPFTFHVEFYLDWAGDIPRSMARYGGSLAWQYQRRVVSLAMLLRPDRAPDVIPTIGEYTVGDTRTIHPYKVLKAWTLNPAPLLETGNPRMFPWAVLMKSTDAEVRKIATALSASGDEESIARFLTLGSLRYDRNQLEEMLEGSRMGLTEAIMEGSSLVKEATDRAARQGRAEGRADEARRLLRVCLRSRFPGLEALPAIDAIQDADAVETLLQHVLTASDPDDIRRRIEEAAS